MLADGVAWEALRVSGECGAELGDFCTATLPGTVCRRVCEGLLSRGDEVGARSAIGEDASEPIISLSDVWGPREATCQGEPCVSGFEGGGAGTGAWTCDLCFTVSCCCFFRSLCDSFAAGASFVAFGRAGLSFSAVDSADVLDKFAWAMISRISSLEDAKVAVAHGCCGVPLCTGGLDGPDRLAMAAWGFPGAHSQCRTSS